MSEGYLVVEYGSQPHENNRSSIPNHRPRTDARFLAQLVAARSNVADQRLKNRALPECGAEAYRLSQAQPLRIKPIYGSRSA